MATGSEVATQCRGTVRAPGSVLCDGRGGVLLVDGAGALLWWRRGALVMRELYADGSTVEREMVGLGIRKAGVDGVGLLWDRWVGVGMCEIGKQF